MSRCLFCALGALVLAACGDLPEGSGLTLDTIERALSNPSSVLGFEDVAEWTVTQGTKSASATHSEGTASLAVRDFTFTTLSSAPLSTISGVTSQIALDLALPASPAWGQLQLFVNIPSRNVFQALVGTAPLAGSPAGSFQTLAFDIPASVLQALQTTYADLSFRVALNLPQSSQDVLLDNLRFLGDTSETEVELQVSAVDDFVYATADNLRRKVWYIGDPDQGQPIDASDWFGAGTHALRLFAINTGGPTSWDIRAWLNDSVIADDPCPASVCDGTNQDEGILFERSLQLATPNRPPAQTVQVTSASPGKLYINDAFTGVTTTGTSTPVAVSLPPGGYTFGLGVSEENPPSYTGQYFERAVQVTTATEAVNLTADAPLPVQEATRVVVIPVRELIVDQFNASSVLGAADLDNFEAQALATRDQWLEPFSYGLVTWDIDFMDVVEDVPLHAPDYTREPNAGGFLDAAGLAHLRQEYEIIVLFYNVFDAQGQVLTGVVDGELRTFNASAWGGGGTVWIHSLWARLWEPTGPNPALLHEVLHNYEGYNHFNLHYYNGVRALHGANEHGYHDGDNGELDFAVWQRLYMRNQVAELTGMRQDTNLPSPPPSADLWVGVFDTVRRGYDPLGSAPALAARSAAAPQPGEIVECPPELFGRSAASR